MVNDEVTQRSVLYSSYLIFIIYFGVLQGTLSVYECTLKPHKQNIELRLKL